jgi:hypothetical protein
LLCATDLNIKASNFKTSREEIFMFFKAAAQSWCLHHNQQSLLYSAKFYKTKQLKHLKFFLFEKNIHTNIKGQTKNYNLDSTVTDIWDLSEQPSS